MIPIATPSQNQIGANGYGRAGARYKACKRRFSKAIRDIGIPAANTPRILFVERTFAGKCHAYDHGNLVGGCKPIIDILVERGWLVNDSPQWLQAWYFQLRGEENCTTLILEELWDDH